MTTYTGYTAVDLSRLPAPEVVETLSFEDLLAEMRADLVARFPSLTALLESEPAYKLLEVFAYRELLLRQRINDAARAVMLAYAVDGDLDNLGAFFGVTRLTLDPGDPSHSIPPTMERNEDYRRRITLAPEGFSVAGPEGAYIYHALSASSDVLDVSATSPAPDDIKALVNSVLVANGATSALINAMTAALNAAKWPGDVTVTVLSRTGNGAAPQATLDVVAARLNDATVRPLTDHVIMQSAQIVNYAVVGTRYTYAGPDSTVVLAHSDASLQAYIAESHRLGRDITRSGLEAAIHVPGIQRVDLTSPVGNVVISRTQAAHCTDVALTYGGTDE